MFEKYGVIAAGISEPQTYLAHSLTDAKWKWEAGKEERPGHSDTRPARGFGMFLSKTATTSVLEVGEFSIWCRIETRAGAPVIVGECYFPHAMKTPEHRRAYDPRQVS